MRGKKKAVFNWSGGKDSALALQKTLRDSEFEVISLLTTINEETLTSSIHSIPLELIMKQADSIGIPLYTVSLSKDKKTYEEGMTEAIAHFKNNYVSSLDFNSGNPILNEDHYKNPPHLPSNIKSIKGSGGNYLSNEIFYRVARMREKLSPSIPTGHIHVPPPIESSEFDIIQLIKDFKNALLKI